MSSLGAFPYQVIYEIAFGNNPFDGAPIWTNVSRFVTDAKWTRGRPHVFNEMVALTGTLRFNNNRGEFSPWNTSSPYYSAGVGFDPLKPFRIRTVVTAGGPTVAEARGFILTWPSKRDGEFAGTVEVSLTDAFSVFAGMGLPSVWEMEVNTDAPIHRYRLGEGDGTTAVDAGSSPVNGVYGGGATFNSRTGLITNDDDAAIGFDGVDDRIALPASAFPTSSTFTIEFWVDDWTGTNLRRVLSYGNQNTTDIFVDLYLWDGGGQAVTFTLWNSLTTYYRNLSSNQPINDGGRHHVMVVIGGTSATSYIYIDGVDRTTSRGTPAGSFVTPNRPGWIGFEEFTGAYLGAVLDELNFYNSALSAARALAHYQAGTAPWHGDTMGVRIGRLLDYIGWPAGDRALDTGISVLTDADLRGETVLSHMQAAAKGEYGAVFMSTDGKVTAHQRDKILKPPYTTSQATFSDSTADGGSIPYGAGVEVERDVLDVWNEIPVSRKAGSVYTAVDAVSRTRYTKRVLQGQTDLIITSDGEIVDRSNYLLAHFKDAVARVRKLALKSSDAPASVLTHLVNRDLRERVTVKQHGPNAAGSTFSQDAHIEQLTKHVTAGGVYEVAYALSAADTQSYLILDTGTLDNDRLGF